MTAFVATYITKSGSRREITLQADNPAMARRTLRQRGILPNNLVRKEGGDTAAVRRHRSSWRDWFERGITVRDLAFFANKLSALVDAGVPLLRGLDLMRAQQRSPKFRRALQSVAIEVNQGESLGNAMRRWPEVFDNLFVAMVDAGEAGGVLDETLRRLAKLLEDNARLQNQVRSAMAYPVTVMVLAILVFLGMAIFLIPAFATIYQELDAELPVFTLIMFEISNLLRSYYAIAFVGVLLLGVYVFQRYYATPTGRRQVDGLLLKVPLFGDLFQKTATARFCRTLSALSNAGVPILMALEIVRDTTANSVIGDAISSSRTQISQGVPLSFALSAKNVFPSMMISMLAIGEETGNMGNMLTKVADFYEDEVSSTVKILTSLIEPFMIIFVGVIVGTMLMAMYLPMFSIFENIR